MIKNHSIYKHADRIGASEAPRGAGVDSVADSVRRVPVAKSGTLRAPIL